MSSSMVLNSKIRGKRIDISEYDDNLISGALSLIWIKTNQKVESCIFEDDAVKISYNRTEGHKTKYFDIYESIDDIDSLLSDFMPFQRKQVELENTKRKLDYLSNELEDYKNKVDLLSRQNISLQNELQKHIQDQSNCDTATSSTRDTVVSSDDEEVFESAKETMDYSTSETMYPVISESKFEDSIAPMQEVRVVIESNFKEPVITREKPAVITPKLTSPKSKSETSTVETHNLRSETSKSRSETPAATTHRSRSVEKEKVLAKGNKKLNKSKKRKVDCIDISSGEEEKDNNRDDDNVEIVNIPKDQGLSHFQSLLLDKGKKLREILLNPHDALDSNSKIIKALRELTAKSLKILNETSAEARIYQWQKQESQCNKFQLGAKSYGLLHLMSLVQVYDDILRVGEELKKDPKNDINDLKLWVIEFLCDKLKIDEKTEQNNRLGCKRLRELFSEGITSDQLIQAKCYKDDFFIKQENYDVFLSQIPSLEKRKNISSNNYLKEYLKEILSLKISNIDLDNLTFSQSNIPKLTYNNEESDDIEVLSFKKNTQNNEKNNTSNKKQKIIFKLHLGEDFSDIAHKYEGDEYIVT